MKHDVLDIDGPVHIADFGGAGQPLLFVHGADGSHANFVTVGRDLAADHRVVAVDLPGFGYTPVEGRRTTMWAYADLVVEVLSRVFGARAVLVGNSMGAPVVLRVAADRPGLVAGVVLDAPALPRRASGPLTPGVAAMAAAFAVPGSAASEAARRRRLAPEVRVEAIIHMCVAPGATVPTADREAMVAVASHRRHRDDAPGAWVRAFRSMLWDIARPTRFHQRAQRVEAPVLVVEGGADPVIPTRSIDAAAARHPTWTRATLDGVGHIPQLEAPDRFVAALRRWEAQVLVGA